MLIGMAIDRLVAEGFTKEQAIATLESLSERINLKRIYSIKVDHDRQSVKVEATHLSPEELFKEAFLYIASLYMIDHKEEYHKNPAKAAKLLREKVEQLQIEACREAVFEE